MARACYLGSMQITLTSMQLADILAPHLPTGYCLYQANADEWQWQHPNRNAFGARQGPSVLSSMRGGISMATRLARFWRRSGRW